MYQFHKVKNHIDDVPMKFSEKYLTLLNNSKLYRDCDVDDDDDDDDDDYNIDQYNVEDYKFDSELIAIEMYELYQKRKEEKLKRNALEKSLTKNVQSTTVQDNWRMACSKFLPDESNSKTTMLYNMISGQILQPQPLNNNYSPLSGTNQSAATAYANCDSNNKNTMLEHFKNNNPLVNPKEFENDDSSPFDNVELQTLDDIKELNKVFGALNLSKEKNPSKSMVPRNSPIQTIEEQTTITTTIPVNNVVTLSSAPPSISYQSYVPNAIYSSQINTNSNGNQPNSYTNYKANSQFDNHRLIYDSNCVGTQYSPLYQSPTHLRQTNTSMPSSIVYNPYYNNAASNIYNYNNNHTATYQIFNNLNNAASDIQKSFLEKKDLHHQINMTTSSRSKSVSDLSQTPSDGELNNYNNMDTLKDRSKTPPSLPGKFNNGIAENDQIDTKIQKQNHHQNQGRLIQTDPYESLNRGQKTFVDHLCQMGFKRDRISRAVKHINTDDDKKIFEYLLALQQLEDQGYDCYEAEIALHFNNYDKREAENFLLTLKQICDLGFDKEKSIKALFKTNNNREKAIESLLKLHH